MCFFLSCGWIRHMKYIHTLQHGKGGPFSRERFRDLFFRQCGIIIVGLGKASNDQNKFHISPGKRLYITVCSRRISIRTRRRRRGRRRRRSGRSGFMYSFAHHMNASTHQYSVYNPKSLTRLKLKETPRGLQIGAHLCKATLCGNAT